MSNVKSIGPAHAPGETVAQMLEELAAIARKHRNVVGVAAIAIANDAGELETIVHRSWGNHVEKAGLGAYLQREALSGMAEISDDEI